MNFVSVAVQALVPGNSGLGPLSTLRATFARLPGTGLITEASSTILGQQALVSNLKYITLTITPQHDCSCYLGRTAGYGRSTQLSGRTHSTSIGDSGSGSVQGGLYHPQYEKGRPKTLQQGKSSRVITFYVLIIPCNKLT